MKKIVEFRQFLPKRKKGSHGVGEIIEFRHFLPEIAKKGRTG